MKRFHALEWEDLHWFPTSWRDYGTDYLGFVAAKFGIYKAINPLLKKGIEASKDREWLDCASGGGAGLLTQVQDLEKEYPGLKVILSDFYPNIQTFERMKAAGKGLIDFEPGSVNAMDVPLHLQGKFRTMFGSFHHFRPKDAAQILQNAVDSNSPIGIFEPVGRNFMSWFSMLFVILNVLLFTPFIRPVRWQVLPFIYILPIIPLYILWDGIASILRTYSEKERQDLVAGLNNSDRFDWEIGKTEGATGIAYLLGIPKQG